MHDDTPAASGRVRDPDRSPVGRHERAHDGKPGAGTRPGKDHEMAIGLYMSEIGFKIVLLACQ